MTRENGNWSEVSLGEICEFRYGKSLPNRNRKGGAFPVYGSNGVVGQHNEALTSGPTIIIGRKGSLGEINFSQSSCWPIDTTYYIDGSATDTDIRWLSYRIADLGLTKLNRAAAIPGLNREDAYRKRLLLPPLSEQRRAAEALDRAEELRAKRRAAFGRLDLLRGALFLDMFGDPAMNQKGWPQSELGTFLADADVFVDGDWVESKDQDPNGEIRLIQLADVGDAQYLDHSTRFLTKQTALRLKCTALKVGDVLVARMPDPLGRACIFPGDAKESVTVVDVCVIRPANTGPDPIWLMSALNTSGFRGLIARQATGTTRERISRGNLSRLRMITPPIELQRVFSKRFAAIQALGRTHRDSLAELDTLFASLQQRAFRGEL